MTATENIIDLSTCYTDEQIDDHHTVEDVNRTGNSRTCVGDGTSGTNTTMLTSHPKGNNVPDKQEWPQGPS
eukprot:gene10671-22273_t